jgi:hypothetical protein
MAYGHAERTLAAIRVLEAATTDLLVSQDPWTRNRRNGCTIRVCGAASLRRTSPDLGSQAPVVRGNYCPLRMKAHDR